MHWVLTNTFTNYTNKYLDETHIGKRTPNIIQRYGKDRGNIYSIKLLKATLVQSLHPIGILIKLHQHSTFKGLTSRTAKWKLPTACRMASLICNKLILTNTYYYPTLPQYLHQTNSMLLIISYMSTTGLFQLSLHASKTSRLV